MLANMYRGGLIWRIFIWLATVYIVLVVIGVIIAECNGFTVGRFMWWWLSYIFLAGGR